MKRKITIVIVLIAFTAVALVAFGQAKKPEKAKDPVCGMMVDKEPGLSVQHKGETYHFCMKADMEEFKKNPEKYAKKK